MSDELFLRVCAGKAILTGRLPVRRADGTWGGHGCGVTCALCQEKISESDLEMELEFRQADLPADVFHLHIRCFAAWEFERTRMPTEQGT